MPDTVNKVAHVSDDAASRRIAEARWKGELARWQDLGDAKSQGREEGIVEGKAEGIRGAILAVLEARFDTVPSDVRALVGAHPDESLEPLLERAKRVTAVTDLFPG